MVMIPSVEMRWPVIQFLYYIDLEFYLKILNQIIEGSEQCHSIIRITFSISHFPLTQAQAREMIINITSEFIVFTVVSTTVPWHYRD